MAQSLAADVNLDWHVDIFDMNVVSSNWGGSSPRAMPMAMALSISLISIWSRLLGARLGTFQHHHERTTCHRQENGVEAAPRAR